MQDYVRMATGSMQVEWGCRFWVLNRGWWTLAITTILRAIQTNYAVHVAQSRSVYCGIVVVDNVLENVIEGDECAHMHVHNVLSSVGEGILGS